MSRNDELNDFWDLRSLIPDKKSRKKPNHSVSTETVEVLVENCRSDDDDNSLDLKNTSISDNNSSEIFNEYSYPSRLISHVKILNHRNSYTANDLFYKQAKYFKTVIPHKCEHVHFFSYMPQYSQMRKDQLAWYIWWRKCVNEGIYLSTDHTYILLYAFELINLANHDNAYYNADKMIDLWNNYHEIYPMLSKNLGEWVCDLALIYDLNFNSLNKRISVEMMKSVTLPEVFYNFDLNDNDLLSHFLLCYCCTYNYSVSKFYVNEEFDKCFNEVIKYICENLSIRDRFFEKKKKNISRNTFIGAVCGSGMRKKIEIDYWSLKMENEFKGYISSVVKYCENKLREQMGVRSRLTVKNLDKLTADLIDKYFAHNYSIIKRTISAPEYEKLYECNNEPLSPLKAQNIEQSSWNVTQKLIEAFEEDSDKECNNDEYIYQSTEFNSENGGISAFWEQVSKYSELINIINLGSSAAQFKYAKENGYMLEAAVDEINAVAAEQLGDILIGESESGYEIIEDYKEMLFKG